MPNEKNEKKNYNEFLKRSNLNRTNYQNWWIES